jgi:hypothetical protein
MKPRKRVFPDLALGKRPTRFVGGFLDTLEILNPAELFGSSRERCHSLSH